MNGKGDGIHHNPSENSEKILSYLHKSSSIGNHLRRTTRLAVFVTAQALTSLTPSLQTLIERKLHELMSQVQMRASRQEPAARYDNTHATIQYVYVQFAPRHHAPRFRRPSAARS